MNKKIKIEQLRSDLRQEFDRSLGGRIERYLQVEPHQITAWTHFAQPSAEATLLFRDGHFYGCVALCQAVVESLVKFMCLKNSWKPSNNYEENVEKLRNRNFISENLQLDLKEIWKNRDDYHHLNPSISTDQTFLEELAKGKAKLLVKIEAEIFYFSHSNDGAFIFKYPQYWKKSEEDTHVQAFLKIRP